MLFGERPEVVIEVSGLGARDIALPEVEITCSLACATRYQRHRVRSRSHSREKESRVGGNKSSKAQLL